MTHTIARALPLGLLLALGACKDKSNDTDTVDTDTDTTQPQETGTDTSPTVDEFQPTTFLYSANFALDEDGLPRTFDLGGEVGSYFQIVLQDEGGDACTLIYFLHDDQYAFAGQAAGGDTDTDADSDSDAAAGNADVLEWLDAHGAQFGFRVASGGYDQGSVNDPDDRCADLTLDYLNDVTQGTYTDIYEAALQLGGTGTMFFGLNTDPTDDTISTWEDANTGIDTEFLLGGFITFPFPVGNEGDTFDAAGLWTDLDEDGAPVNDGQNLTFNQAADAFDDASQTPAPGFFEFISPTSIIFQ